LKSQAFDHNHILLVLAWSHVYILLRYNVANLIIKLLMLTTPMKQYIANELPKETGMDLLICASLIISLICKFTHLTIEFISIYKFLVIFVSKCFFALICHGPD